MQEQLTARARRSVLVFLVQQDKLPRDLQRIRDLFLFPPQSEADSNRAFRLCQAHLHPDKARDCNESAAHARFLRFQALRPKRLDVARLSLFMKATEVRALHHSLSCGAALLS